MHYIALIYNWDFKSSIIMLALYIPQRPEAKHNYCKVHAGKLLQYNAINTLYTVKNKVFRHTKIIAIYTPFPSWCVYSNIKSVCMTHHGVCLTHALNFLVHMHKLGPSL